VTGMHESRFSQGQQDLAQTRLALFFSGLFILRSP